MNILLNSKKVAEMLHLPVATVYKLAKSGKLPTYKLGKEFRFEKRDVKKYLQSREITDGISDALVIDAPSKDNVPVKKNSKPRKKDTKPSETWKVSMEDHFENEKGKYILCLAANEDVQKTALWLLSGFLPVPKDDEVVYELRFAGGCLKEVGIQDPASKLKGSALL